MMNRPTDYRRLAALTLACSTALACGIESSNPSGAEGLGGTGGFANGASGGAGASHAGAGGSQPSGGSAGNPGFAGTGGTFGSSPNGGASNAGSASGGSFNGGSSNGGAANGGSSNGGAANGGSAHAGSTNGGATTGGSPGTSAGGSASGGSGTGTGTGPWQFPAGVTKPRIMIVGDSISAGPGCYKKYLLQDLTTNHYSNFQFVGEYSDDCGGFVRHSAVSCSTAEQYTNATFTMPNCSQGITFKGLSSLMTSQKPDMVMLQLGVNDVWGGATVATILGRYTTLVQQARAANPAVVLVVAEIQKINPNCSTDPTLTNLAQALDKAVPAWAKNLNTVTSPVFTADLWSNSNPTMAETIDCIHPNDVGAQKMGMNWYNALKGILKPD